MGLLSRLGQVTHMLVSQLELHWFASFRSHYCLTYYLLHIGSNLIALIQSLLAALEQAAARIRRERMVPLRRVMLRIYPLCRIVLVSHISVRYDVYQLLRLLIHFVLIKARCLH